MGSKLHGAPLLLFAPLSSSEFGVGAVEAWAWAVLLLCITLLSCFSILSRRAFISSGFLQFNEHNSLLGWNDYGSPWRASIRASGPGLRSGPWRIRHASNDAGPALRVVKYAIRAFWL